LDQALSDRVAERLGADLSGYMLDVVAVRSLRRAEA